jgi:hypothetical protein
VSRTNNDDNDKKKKTPPRSSLSQLKEKKTLLSHSLFTYSFSLRACLPLSLCLYFFLASGKREECSFPRAVELASAAPVRLHAGGKANFSI